jgi:hypothetical protein
MSERTTATHAGRCGRPGRRASAGWVRTALVAVALAAGSLPSAVRAADVDDDEDGRFIGYAQKKVGIEKGGTTLTLLGFLALATIGCIPLFKAAKRD